MHFNVVIILHFLRELCYNALLNNNKKYKGIYILNTDNTDKSFIQIYYKENLTNKNIH